MQITSSSAILQIETTKERRKNANRKTILRFSFAIF